jgi:hypothetical protein
MIVREEYTDETRKCIVGEDEVVLSEEDSKPGDIYRSYLQEGWACKSSVYIDDRESGDSQRIGWHFVRRSNYEDTNESYLAGLWVTLIESIVTHVNYASLPPRRD